LAWLLATCPDSAVRNGGKATDYVTQALQLNPNGITFSARNLSPNVSFVVKTLTFGTGPAVVNWTNKSCVNTSFQLIPQGNSLTVKATLLGKDVSTSMAMGSPKQIRLSVFGVNAHFMVAMASGINCQWHAGLLRSMGGNYFIDVRKGYCIQFSAWVGALALFALK